MALNQLPRYEENRQRARDFVKRWEGERRERAEKDSFWNDFLQIFGVERRQVARFEAVAKRYSTGRHGFIDLFWPGRLLVEHKSAGEDLEKAMMQALDYLPGMDENDVPAVVVVCDFDRFVVRDMESGRTERFLLNNLPVKLELFGMLEGRDRRSFDSDEDVNLAATEHIARFGEVLELHGYPEHQRRVLLTRIVFCLFADDAGVWPLGAFEDFLRLRTRPDGSDLGAQLDWLFQVLNKGDDRRGGLPQDMLDFTYVNGGIFAERLDTSGTDEAMRDSLLKASRFNWSRISPAIFGSMFQNVMSKEQRRNLGAHYTSEKNILKLIRPLFLDDLEAELAKARTANQLRAFRDKLATLTFFDPACGCGNFLIVTYLHLRRLETECLVRLKADEAKQHRIAAGFGQQSLDVAMESKIRVSQFFGIEIDEWPCRIAEVAMHIAAHLADRELSSALGGGYYAHFPIEDVAKLHNANALTTDWNEVLPAELCNFLLGNPPFIAGLHMTPAQQNERNSSFLRLGYKNTRTGYMDYVTSWFATAMRYLQGHRGRAAFVSTNSVTQGEQARFLGPLLEYAGFAINFAHRPFSWRNEAKGNANVHVVIIGLMQHPDVDRLFDYPKKDGDAIETRATNINIYLADAPSVHIRPRKTPLVPTAPTARGGNKPVDGGHLLVEPQDYETVLADPDAAKYLRPFRHGARDLLNDRQRYCLWLVRADPRDLRESAVLRARLEGVRTFRLTSKTEAVRRQADQPALFSEVRERDAPFIAMPKTSSGLRRYIPGIVSGADLVPGDGLVCWSSSDLWLLGLLQSRAYTLWVDTIAGKLKSDYRMSPDLTYATFPMPTLDDDAQEALADLAQNLLDERARHAGATLADLYDPLAMPADILRAHQAIDRRVNSAYGRVRTEGDLLSLMFSRYEALSR